MYGELCNVVFKRTNTHIFISHVHIYVLACVPPALLRV